MGQLRWLQYYTHNALSVAQIPDFTTTLDREYPMLTNYNYKCEHGTAHLINEMDTCVVLFYYILAALKISHSRAGFNTPIPEN